MSFNSLDIFGSEIQYFRLDPRYWDAILQKFKDAGLRCVTTYVQWRTHLIGEPDAAHPAGLLDFEGKTDARLNLMGFLDLVQKHGLLLNFRCGPFCCNEMVHGGYPHWLVNGEPDIMVWDSVNRPTQGYWIARREGMQPSYLHPTYLDWCRKWLDQVDPIIRPRLKSSGGFITMVNLDNEVSYIVQDGFLSSDYNPVNVRPGGFYHQFLRERYGTSAAVSETYGKPLASIEDIQPPRAIPKTIGRDFAWYADWMQFKTWCMARYIQTLREMHEANGVIDVTFMTNLNPHRPEGVPTRMPDFQKAVGPNGIVGYDFYRGAFMSYSGYHSMARVLKLMQASLPYTWSAEFMSGLWNLDMSKTSRISDDHMCFMARCAMAQGCKAISWFMFHDRDCWGDCPVSSHGHRRPSLDVLKQTVAMIREQIPDWDQLTPTYDLAIVYDLVAHLHTSIGDPSPCADGELHIGEPAIDGVGAGLASNEYEALFRLAEHAGRQAGVVDVMQDPSLLKQYRLVLFPGSPVASGQASQSLRQFCEQGGTVVLSGCWPGRDELGCPLRFMDVECPGQTKVKLPIGKGQLVWHPDWLGQSQPEHDTLEAIAFVRELALRHSPVVASMIDPVDPVSWVDWGTKAPGATQYTQPRNLGSAVLHKDPSGKPALLFVLNHYITAAEFRIELDPKECHRLIDLDSGQTITLIQGKTTIDVDRKAARVFRIKPGQ